MIIGFQEKTYTAYIKLNSSTYIFWYFIDSYQFINKIKKAVDRGVFLIIF